VTKRVDSQYRWGALFIEAKKPPQSPSLSFSTLTLHSRFETCFTSIALQQSKVRTHSPPVWEHCLRRTSLVKTQAGA